MPIVNGNYQQLTEEEIISALETELRNEFGNDIDLTESSVFSQLVSTLAAVTADNQEESLEDIYSAGSLDTATGIDLDRVVGLIGIQRRSPIKATGVEQFQAAGPVDQDFIIQRGTTVQTDGGSPVDFETMEVATLELIDSFEDGDITEYSGDTGSGSVVSDNSAPQGSDVLELDATSGAHIYNDNITLKQGTTLHCHVLPKASTVPTVTFGVNPSDADDHYQLAVDEANDEVRLELVENGTISTTIDTLSSAGLTAGSYHELKWAWSITNNIGVTVYDPNGNELGTLGGADSTRQKGHPGFKSGDANDTKRFDWYTTSAVSANIRAIDGGNRGNVGANSITSLPAPISGVDSVTNLYPTADTSYTDRSGETFVIGKEEETDEELRSRAQESVAGGGTSTHDALVSALINDTPGVTSVTVYQNKTDADNTPGGLPPYSFEAVVFGGDDADVAQTIFDNKAITARDYGGANGSATSATVNADSNSQTRTINWSRPTKVTIDMTLDLAVDDSYIGDNDIRDKIVDYIGGTLANGSETVGLGVSENVRIDQIRDIVVGDDTGVVGFDQSVDGDVISSTPSTTTVNGLEVISIGANEVAQTDATDSSITLNTRTI